MCLMKCRCQNNHKVDLRVYLLLIDFLFDLNTEINEFDIVRGKEYNQSL